MPSFKKCDSDVRDMALELMDIFPTHKPLVERGVRVDYLFAFGDRDETTGELKNYGLKRAGIRALGVCKVVSLKDRTKGMGDAEITLDGDYWNEIDKKDQEAILDHELHHIVVSMADNDALGRPKLKLRKHDFEVGWFKVIADRHGVNSVERRQAKVVFDTMGQSFWPGLVVQHTDSGEKLAPVVRIGNGYRALHWTRTAGQVF